MRELKLRAWHEDNRDFVYATIKTIWQNGFHIGQAMELWNAHLIDRTKEGYATDDYFEEETSFKYNANWKQYTGLKDKNGKEMYEGDIIKAVHPDELCFFNGYIKYDCEFGFYKLMRKYYCSIPIFEFDEIEVIGNIYENPELLKKS